MATIADFSELASGLGRLYGEGRYAAALELVEKNAGRFPEEIGRTTFWRMCLLSLCGRSGDVLSVFQQGLDAGLWWAEGQFADTDLDAVRDLPEFKRLVAISQEKCLQARTQIRPDRALLVPGTSTQELPLLVALHGRNGNKESSLKHWEVARQRGWLVLSPQSTQPLFPGSYCWDDPEQGLADILFHFEEILQTYRIDRQSVIIAGMSQGSGMAIYAALSGKLPVRGFISVAAWWVNPDSLAAIAAEAKDLRGYFVVGEKDHALGSTRKIQEILRDGDVPFNEEVHSDLGHEFPSDFEKSFRRAVDFILKE